MFTNVEALREHYRQCLNALQETLNELLALAAQLQQVIEEAQRELDEAEARMAEALAMMASDDEDVRAAGEAMYAEAVAQAERARQIIDIATAKLNKVQYAIAMTQEAISAVEMALAGLQRHIPTEEAIQSAPNGVAIHTDSYGRRAA